jgi:SNF2 family DNA or RNA helicase
MSISLFIIDSWSDVLSRDDMGLGKTVQMIATMAMNMPDLDAAHRSTLIVVPAALLQQVSACQQSDPEHELNLQP